jgi:hypothetical protein
VLISKVFRFHRKRNKRHGRKRPPENAHGGRPRPITR